MMKKRDGYICLILFFVLLFIFSFSVYLAVLFFYCYHYHHPNSENWIHRNLFLLFFFFVEIFFYLEKEAKYKVLWRICICFVCACGLNPFELFRFLFFIFQSFFLVFFIHSFIFCICVNDAILQESDCVIPKELYIFFLSYNFFYFSYFIYIL